jgi:hypothetical protein
MPAGHALIQMIKTLYVDGSCLVASTFVVLTNAHSTENPPAHGRT